MMELKVSSYYLLQTMFSELLNLYIPIDKIIAQEECFKNDNGDTVTVIKYCFDVESKFEIKAYCYCDSSPMLSVSI